MSEGFEETPRKKWGKNHNKSSPNNKRGCPSNGGSRHIYEKVRIRTSYTLPFPPYKGEFKYVVEMCIGCHKRSRKRLWNYTGSIYSEIDERTLNGNVSRYS